jgi:predicted acetyltransferase
MEKHQLSRAFPGINARKRPPMLGFNAKISMRKITLQPAHAGDEACIENLMQLYHYDASEWYPLDLEADGRYKFRPVARFWTNVNQHPFLIYVDDALAGFAVVDDEVTETGSQFNIGYLFVAQKYRKSGIGRDVAHQLFRQFRGRWEVYQLTANTNAIAFWRATISSFTNGNFSEHRLAIDDEPCVQQRFSSHGQS